MRFMRGPSFAIVCIIVVAAGVALGWVWFPRAAAPTRPDARHYHQQEAIIRELERAFRNMAVGIARTLARHDFTCNPCAQSSDPGMVGSSIKGSWVMGGEAGVFKRFNFQVLRQSNTTAQFTFSTTFITPDGRMEMNEQERASSCRSPVNSVSRPRKSKTASPRLSLRRPGRLVPAAPTLQGQPRVEAYCSPARP